MKHISHSVLAVDLCLLFAVGVSGQTQRATGVRSADVASTVSRPAEPDSPGTNATVAAGPQANGASAGTIVPRLMKFSGVLHDAPGKPLTGTVDVTFSLYSTEAGGNPLWFETQSVQADEVGRYTALLGAMHTDGLPIDLFTSGEVRWLGIQVGLEAEQQPRVLLVSVPYALKAGDAETLGGKALSDFMLKDTSNTASGASGQTSSATTSSTGVRQAQSTTTESSANTTGSTPVTTAGGTVNYVPLWDSTSDITKSAISQSNGNIGIGTTTPIYALQIVTNSPGNGIYLNAQTFGAGYFLARAGTLEGFFSVAGQAGGYSAVALGNDAVFGAQSAPSNGNLIFTTQNAAGNIKFATGSSASNDTTKMIITNAGDVGIGTSTPAHTLDVVGDVNATGTFTGIGSGLTGVTASGLSCTGCVATADLASSAVTSTNIAAGTITGANVSSTAGINPTAITGTAATLGANIFTGNQTVTGNLSVSGSYNNALVLQPSVTDTSSGNTFVSANVEGGFMGATGGNRITAGVTGGTIGGGGGTHNGTAYANTVTDDFGTVGGGAGNQAGDNAGTVADHAYATVSGGVFNTASGYISTIGGGISNTATGEDSVVSGGQTNGASGAQATVAGGNVNTASGAQATVAGGNVNTASGTQATVGGGINNTASALTSTVIGGGGNTASGPASTVAGGEANAASAYYSFAAGCQARAVNIGDFVWSGSTGGGSCTTLSTTGGPGGQFVALAPGGITFYAATNLSNAVTIAAGTGVISGNGSGLTGVTASTLAAGTYSNVVSFTSASNSFAGNGSGLTSLTPANITSGTAGISISGNAATATSAASATNALALGGVAPSGYAPAAGSTVYVAKAGDTMTGTLNLPANGLMAGTNQLALSGGNVGIGTGSPGAVLDVEGPTAAAVSTSTAAPPATDAMDVVGGAGAANSGGGDGGAGASANITAGAGGANNTGANSGGLGGSVNIRAGAGGIASNVGGGGGSVTIAAGAGSFGTLDGGNGGSIFLNPGLGGGHNGGFSGGPGSAGNVTVNGNMGIGTVSPKATLDTAGQDRRMPVTFTTLTACSGTIEGETAAITDSTTATWGAAITGGGTNHVLGYCDGTAWTVAAK